ncbi:uncharacterized protein (DUF58 family) [Paenibacillus cellulosilyticus]|uniref:Uncharacterized protein (DUF58 family) n=1 Tax=Paenibacillus cellulosilyticus TaxID=375489 RepID=A0A2V2YRY2_9BACL|nr:DUF58 domain-containing protein [Paenibacillus cellulosilyticus]PWW00764.1 uncharacterized protein (DUF58 family) [Paenibacillus cellulosilyticus]QKS45619.1 DUF58 domain-containing protein [Paenibacillus cellulosilyticus]
MTAYWFLIITGLIVFIQNRIFKAVSLRRVRYSRQFDRRTCFEGDEVALVETIANEKRFPLPWLRVESLLSASLRFGHDHASNLDISAGQFLQNHRSFFSLMPWRRIRRTHHVKASHRGCYELSTVTLSTGDLFGLSAASNTLNFSERLIVYPQPVLPDDLALPPRSWQGDMSVKRWVVEDPFRRIGVRPYRSGDSLRQVNWSATARTGDLQVHQLDTTADYAVLIVLNVEDHAEVWRTINDVDTIEQGIRIAAGTATHLIRNGMEAGFASNGMLKDEMQSFIHVPPTGGEPHLFGILETMSMLLIERQLPFYEYLLMLSERLDQPTDLLLLSTHADDRVVEAIDRLAAEGHRVIVRLLHAEGEANAS